MIEYDTILLWTDVTFTTSRTQAAIETDLMAAAAEGFRVVGANNNWILLAREFVEATPT